MQRQIGPDMSLANDNRQLVVYACAPNFWVHTYVSLYSLLLHNQEISFDVRILAVERDNHFFRYVELLDRIHLDFEVSWIPVDAEAFAGAPSAHYTDACYYRLLLGRLLPDDISRVLYLDGDVIVRGSLNGLFSVDLNDNVLAAVPQHSFETNPWVRRNSPVRVGLPEGTPYLNSGVLWINLSLWRELGIEAHCFEYIARNRHDPTKLLYPDQDTLNAVLAGHWVPLDPVFNYSEVTIDPRSFAVMNDPSMSPLIAHYAGKRKPWDVGCPHPYASEYWDIRMRTPYANRRRYLWSELTRLAMKPVRSLRGWASGFQSGDGSQHKTGAINDSQ
jgi:lipopolysaccharide biosynthesis glycosyltransferase